MVKRMAPFCEKSLHSDGRESINVVKSWVDMVNSPFNVGVATTL